MLKYVAGAKPGKKLPTTERKSSNDYEKSRKRDFQGKWLNIYPWLKYENNVMYCSVCRVQSMKTKQHESLAFVKSTDNFKLESVKQHDDSIVHKRYIEIGEVKSQPSCKSKAAEALRTLHESQHNSLAIKFRTAHALAKTHMSFRTYSTICVLDEAKGLDVGVNYRNDKAVASFTKAIATVVQRTTVEKLKNTQFCSFTIDGSTDFTGDDLENIYIRTVHSGRVEDTFLHIGCAESGSSKHIHEHVKEVFAKLHITDEMQSKLVGFTADGAANMQGINKILM